MPFDVSSIFDNHEQEQQALQKTADAPRTPETVGSEIRYLSHQAKCMTVWFGVEIGKRLSEAKAMVGHGGWLDFLKNETEFSKSAASRFMQIAREYGNSSNFPTLGNLSVSNALQLLAIPAEEREEFAEAVDAENLSARELEQAIRERDEARKQLEAERQASEGTALQLADVRAALDAEKACTAQLRQKADDQAEKIKELENRPVEVAVAAADPAEIDNAVNEALAAAEKKHKAEVAELEKRRKAAEKRQSELQAEVSKALADAKNDGLQVESLNAKISALQTELAKAKRDAEQIKKSQTVQSDADVAVFKSFFDAVQDNFNRACGLLRKVKLRDEEKAEKLSRFSHDALSQMLALLDKEG